MQRVDTLGPTIADRLWSGSESLPWLKPAVLMVVGSLLLWASAKVQVPFWPVPLTMQSFVVLAIGAAYGWRLGAATVLLYLFEGAVGLPVFAGTPEKGIGLAYMMGPTGGYLVGFVFAAAVTGFLAERGFDRHPLWMFVAMMIGAGVYYIFGLAWLGHLIGFEKAVQFGLFPFILGDMMKAALAACLFPAAWQMLGRDGDAETR